MSDHVYRQVLEIKVNLFISVNMLEIVASAVRRIVFLLFLTKFKWSLHVSQNSFLIRSTA